MYLRTFFNWLVPPFRPIEKKILTAVRERLSPSAAQLFSAQCREINFVQRRFGGREVGLYVVRKGAIARDETLRLPLSNGESRLARVRLRKNGSSWTATVHLVNGHLTSIEYDSAPPVVDAEDVIVTVELLEPPPPPQSTGGSVPMLPPWLQQYAGRLDVRNVAPPLPIEDRAAIIDTLESTLPEDYLDFLSSCNGVDIGSLSLAGVDDVYETSTDDHHYIVLGQLNGRGALAVRKPGPTIVFMDYENGSITLLGPSLRAAIEKLAPS